LHQNLDYPVCGKQP